MRSRDSCTETVCASNVNVAEGPGAGSAYLADGLTLCSFSGTGDHSQHPCSCTDKHHRTIRDQRAASIPASNCQQRAPLPRLRAAATGRPSTARGKLSSSGAHGCMTAADYTSGVLSRQCAFFLQVNLRVGGLKGTRSGHLRTPWRPRLRWCVGEPPRAVHRPAAREGSGMVLDARWPPWPHRPAPAQGALQTLYRVHQRFNLNPKPLRAD